MHHPSLKNPANTNCLQRNRRVPSARHLESSSVLPTTKRAIDWSSET